MEIGLVPLGSIGLSLFGIDLYFASHGYSGINGVGPLSFIVQPGGFRVLFDILMIGLFGGLYIVPLYAMVQARTDDEKRARVIGCNNILNALFMVFSSLLGILFLGVAGFSIPDLFLTVALMNIAIAVFIFQQVPEFTMRFLVWLLSHTIYRVEHQGLEHIPRRGSAMIVCNHVSYVDALLLAGAVRRLCLFPEGKLTQDGEINEFKTGIERILERNPVPVVPMALQGLWGSFFSHSHGGVFKKPFRPHWRHIKVLADSPIPPEQATAQIFQEQVAHLRGSYR